MTRSFTGLGRFVVRFRIPVVVTWIVLAVICVHLLPSLASVSKDSNSAFLPASSPSERAAELASPFQNSKLAAATLVAVTTSGPLTGAQDQAITRFEASLRTLPHVRLVRDLGTSTNGQARQALIEAAVPAFGGGDAAQLVNSIRSEFKAARVSGLTFYLTGDLPTIIDSQQSSKHSQNLTQLFSVVFIIALLLVAFRALLAPFITLLPAALVLALSGPVVAEATHVGVQVSVITQVLLIVLVLGAGTDYGLFLVFRVREELRRGLDPHAAVVKAVSTVGESITFSALTVIVALLSLVLAQFGLYQSLGPALAIGIGLMLLAGLTLLPALLAIFGRAVFWPTRTTLEDRPRTGIYSWLAKRVVRQPTAILIAGLVFFGGIATGALTSTTAGFGNTSAPSGTNSAAGAAVLARDYPASNVQSSAVLFRLPYSVWGDAAVLSTAQAGLTRSHQFRTVVGALPASGLTSAQVTALHAELGAPNLLPPTETGATVSPKLYNAYRELAQFISPDGHTIQFSTLLLHDNDNSAIALAAVPKVRTAVAKVATRIGAGESGLFGILPFAYDVESISNNDLIHIIPVVTVLIALLLALVLRSLVAPVYLVVSVVLSYLATLGLVSVVFVHLLGQDGINFLLPFLLFVFLMALGSDYNILMMTRIREEVHQMPLRQAIQRAVGMTGATISTAGLVLGGTFAVLGLAGGASSGGSEIQQIGFGVAAGVFMDTFIIRTVVVPSAAVILGRWNWWPSRLSQLPPTPGTEKGPAA